MKLALPVLALTALVFVGCGDEVINRQQAMEIQKPIAMTVADDKEERSLASGSFTVAAIEPGQSYKQSVVISNSGRERLGLLVAVKTPLWLDNDGYRRVWLNGNEKKTVTFYFVGDEEARGQQGRIDFTLATL